MTKIKWTVYRAAYRHSRIVASVDGISTYPSRAAAERQVKVWSAQFPDNKYYIEGPLSTDGLIESLEP
jgi:hypothetical protein